MATSTTLTLPTPSRRQLLVGATAAAAVGLTAPRASATARSAPAAPAYLPSRTYAAPDATRVRTWAADTWHSLVAMTDPKTGLPADNIPESLAAGDRSGYTSPTNIGGYLWSTVVARELGLIGKGECTKRLVQTLQTLLHMEHHTPSGMYYNWYDEGTAKPVVTWPDSGDKVYPFCSSVDNGWLGAALLVVQRSDKGAAPLARRIFGRMRWDAFYNDNSDPDHQVRAGGLIHGGFFPFDHNRPGGVYRGTHIGGDPVWLTTHHYDTTVSETRITSYLGIITGLIPGKQYFAMWRTFPDLACDWSWQEMRPVGENRTYYGLEVFEGAYTYRGMHIVPGWGGSMFEELMPDMFVPESSWAPRSWGVNHPLHIRAQREHGLIEAGYGYWGFSPASNPMGGYREFGVDQLGLNPDGYLSDIDTADPDFKGTNFDAGYEGCREGTNPNPTYRDGVVTPHAAFLAMMHEPQQAYTNLAGIQDELKAYGRGGFFDAVAVKSGLVARRYLSLDQAMVMGAIGNVLADNVIRRAFSTSEVEARLRPVIGVEEFGAGPA